MPETLYYSTWLFETFLVSLSQYFLFLLLWHLGTKEDYKPISEKIMIPRRESVDTVLCNSYCETKSSTLNYQVWMTLLITDENPLQRKSLQHLLLLNSDLEFNE